MGLFGAGDPPCPAGSICSGQAATNVGKKTTTVTTGRNKGSTRTTPGTKIYHASATKLNSDGTSTTDVYIIKDGSWQKAATTTDGGKTYTYDDNVAGAGFKNELSNPQGAIHKNVDANINKAADKADVPKQEKDKLVSGNQNTAPKGNNNDSGDTSQPASQPSVDTPTVNQTPTNPARNSFPSLVYPEGLGKSKQDIIKFNMVKYEPKKFSGVGFSGRREVTDENIIGSVVLPVPGGIKDTNAVQWGSENMNPLEAATAAASLGFISGGAEGLKDAAGAIAGSVSAGREDIKTALAAVFAGAATGTGAQLLTRTTGAIINPNMELLFKGPSLRPFNFTFKLSPRSKEEAKTVIAIIRFFKQGMAPITTPSNIFLKSPHTFKIQYKLRGDGAEEHPYIGKIKECALQSFNVEYTPEGNYATFTDGVMASYQISMTFQELEPVFNNDYPDDNDASLGF